MYPKLVCFFSLLFYILANCIPRRYVGHYVDGKYNEGHDNKAILGYNEKETFDQLTPEERMMRLSDIVDKIDKDHDGKITREELKDWIEYIQLKHFQDEVNKRWGIYDKNADGKISWEEFKTVRYGSDEDDERRSADKKYRKNKELDKKKWLAADSDKDSMLTKEEYNAFLHPNEFKRMHKAAADRIVNDIDKDEDGFVSLEEYLGDLNLVGDGQNIETKKLQREDETNSFKTERDTDGDGKLNADEVVEWIFPVGYIPLDAETDHLIYQIDANNDKSLTKREILSKHEYFVGSRATNFGESLNRPIDEL